MNNQAQAVQASQGYNKYKDKFNLCKYSNKSNTDYKARETVLDKLEKGLTISSRDGATSPSIEAEDIYGFNGDGGKNNSQKTEEREIILQLFKDNAGGEVFPDVQGSVEEDLNIKKDLPNPSSPDNQDQPSTTNIKWESPNTNLIHRLGLYSGLSSSLSSLPDQFKYSGESDYQSNQGSANGYLSLTNIHHQSLLSHRSNRPVNPAVMNNNSHLSGRSRHKSGPPIGDGNDDNYQLGKDEKMAREAGVTLSIQDIIHLPMDEFNDLLARQDLTEDQLNMCRDIRRRGKNKVAAQNCRKRKIDQIDELQEKLHNAKQQKGALRQKHQRLTSTMREEAQKLNNLISRILMSHNFPEERYTIKVTQDEQVRIVNKSFDDSSVNGQTNNLLMKNTGSGDNKGTAANLEMVEDGINFGSSSQILHHPIDRDISLLPMEEKHEGGSTEEKIHGAFAEEINHGIVAEEKNEGVFDGGRKHGAMNGEIHHGNINGQRSHGNMDGNRSHGNMDGNRNHGALSGGSNPRILDWTQNQGMEDARRNRFPRRSHEEQGRNHGTMDDGRKDDETVVFSC